MGNYDIKFFEEAAEEYANLDGSQKIFVDKAINRIKLNGMNCGEQLHHNLHKCRKLKNRKMGLRIVFTQDNDNVNIIEIVVIGKRDKKEVYKSAGDRL